MLARDLGSPPTAGPGQNAASPQLRGSQEEPLLTGLAVLLDQIPTGSALAVERLLVGHLEAFASATLSSATTSADGFARNIAQSAISLRRLVNRSPRAYAASV